MERAVIYIVLATPVRSYCYYKIVKIVKFINIQSLRNSMVDWEQVKKYENFDNVSDEVQSLDEQMKRPAKHADLVKHDNNLAFAIINYHGGIFNVRERIENPKKYDEMRRQIGMEAAKFRNEQKRPELERIVSKE